MAPGNTNSNILIKRAAETSPKYGKKPNERTVEEMIPFCIVNINKPKGPTSHQVSYYLQKVLGIDKAGHSGTLDPAVTGVLPIATGRATRIVQALLPAGKEYVCVMHLHKDVAEELLRAELEKFIGSIRQLPPVKSAVKRQWRTRHVYDLEVLQIKGKDVLFRVSCEAGTYIRKLCHDIGVKLGVGAHMAELLRTRVGPFMYEHMTSLQDVRDALWYYKEQGDDSKLRGVLYPVEKGVELVKKIWILDSTVDAVCHGSLLKIPGIAKIHDGIKEKETVAIMTLKDELVAMGSATMSSENMMKAERGVCSTIDKVFMLTGTYPRLDQAPKTPA